jgi:hypothetical protein
LLDPECLLRTFAWNELNRFRVTSHLPMKQRPLAVNCDFDRPTTLFGGDVLLATSKRDRPSLGHPSKEAAARKVAIHVVQIKQLCLPFRLVLAARMPGLWIGLKCCLPAKPPASKMRTQHLPTRSYACPECE